MTDAGIDMEDHIPKNTKNEFCFHEIDDSSKIRHFMLSDFDLIQSDLHVHHTDKKKKS